MADLKPGDLVAVAKQLPDIGQPHQLDLPDVKTKVIGSNQTGVKYDLDITSNYNAISLPTHTLVDLMWWLRPVHRRDWEWLTEQRYLMRMNRWSNQIPTFYPVSASFQTLAHARHRAQTETCAMLMKGSGGAMEHGRMKRQDNE